ncbi:MAG: hypothetical protein M1831_003199 [Alyxoria varia]|nr:MAG: hypothetical protein M1831_003199 [Alyxoria varia]
MAAERLSSILSHITPTKGGISQVTSQNPDDVVITLAIRTPLTKAGKGGFKDTLLDGMVYKLLCEVVTRSKLDPQVVEDICLGNVNDSKAALYIRAASLAAGFPNATAASSVNRFCSSGLKAVQDIANQIHMGSIDCGLALGAESMSTPPEPHRAFVDELMESNSEAKDCLQPMGQTSENVGADFNIPRELQDEYAAESYARAERAQKSGWFDDEIVPVTTKIEDPKSGEEKPVTLTKDEGPRWGTNYESLSKVKPAFKMYGDKSTGGNSSQVTDGAAAVLMMKRSRAKELGQPILGKFVGATVQGLAPRIMGIGPSLAIPKLLGKLNITLDQCDVIELNEAFASMAVYCKDVLKIPHDKMNIRGGAIALGHPLGCTGARQIVTGLSECRRQKKKILLTSMCIGTGQGMAGLVPARPAEVESSTSEATNSLVDVDGPHVSSVPSDFESQSIKTDTQAARIDLTNDDSSRAQDKQSDKRDSTDGSSFVKKLARNKENPVILGNVIATAAVVGLLGWGGSRLSKGGAPRADVGWGVGAAVIGAVGLFGLGDYMVSKWALKKYPVKD